MAAHEGGSLAYMPATRREIVLLLRRRGESRAEELAASVGVSVGAVRQQLSALTSDGFVITRERISGPGRPKHFYGLAPVADDLFRQDGRQIAGGLAAFLEERAPELLDEYLDRDVGRWETKIPAEAGDKARELPDRMSRLARWLDDEGFMPSVRVAKGDGAFDLTLNNCPVLCLAMGSTKVCDRTEEGLRQVFNDVEIIRTEWRGSGDRCCTYRFKAPPMAVAGAP